MVICPRCQQPVDETVRTTCPLCSTSIVGATPPVEPGTIPQPGVMPLGGVAPAPGVMPLNGPQPVVIPPPSGMPSAPMNVPLGNTGLASNQRMSLNGDVFEVAPPISAPAGNSQYQARTSSSMPRKEVSTKEQTSPSSMIVPVVVVLLLALVGFGGYYYYMNRTTPKDQAVKYFAAVKENNYKVIYNTLEVDSEKYKDEKDFVDQSQTAYSNLDPKIKELQQSILSGIQFQVGATKTNNGNEATVPVTITGSVTINLFGMSRSQDINMTQDIKMKNFQGIWKVSKDNSTGAAAAAFKGMPLPGS